MLLDCCQAIAAFANLSKVRARSVMYNAQPIQKYIHSSISIVPLVIANHDSSTLALIYCLPLFHNMGAQEICGQFPKKLHLRRHTA